MTTPRKKREDILYFPLGNLKETESLFKDPDKGIFNTKYEKIMGSILGRQLAVNTYYDNDLIARANTQITIELLKVFDSLKINFKVNIQNLTEEERNHAFDLAMSRIIESKRSFLETIKPEAVPEIQESVHEFISRTIENQDIEFYGSYYNDIKNYIKMAYSVITSDRNYIGTAAAIRAVIENEQKIFNLSPDAPGETIAHVIKTTQIALLLANSTDEFSEEELEKLSIICLGHDAGKVLIPESIMYKKGRLTQVENDIMKSHVLLSFILASKNQDILDFESFVMALHHLKEDERLPQSYGITKDAFTSFYDYLTPDAQSLLDEIHASTQKYYRIISIADTFEAITAQRVYKKASSVGKAVEIILNENRKGRVFHQGYLELFIRIILKQYLPKNMVFKLDDKFMDTFYISDQMTEVEKKLYKKEYLGVIAQNSPKIDSSLKCIIFNEKTHAPDRRLEIPPLYFLSHIYFK